MAVSLKVKLQLYTVFQHIFILHKTVLYLPSNTVFVEVTVVASVVVVVAIVPAGVYIKRCKGNL